jgi:hypothetical protein
MVMLTPGSLSSTKEVREHVGQNLLFNKQAVGLLFSLWFIAWTNGVAQQSENKAGKQPYSLQVTPKLHSAGHFVYRGIYLNHHLNTEVNVTYKYKQMGVFVSKYIDFVDAHSSINYATTGLFRSFQFNKSFKLTPYLGYFFKQANSFADRGSDMWACVVVRFTINEWIWIENTSLVGNLLQRHATTSLANRLNVTILMGKFKLDSYTWYTHSLHTEPYCVSASLALTSPEWELSPTVSTKVQISALQQITEEKPAGAFDRGVLLSLIVPIDCSSK